MKFYTVDGTYFITLKEARRQAQSQAVDSFHDVEVNIVEVSNDRINLLRMLNVDGGHTVIGDVVFVAKSKQAKQRAQKESRK
jgi:hypothetical protein